MSFDPHPTLRELIDGHEARVAGTVPTRIIRVAVVRPAAFWHSLARRVSPTYHGFRPRPESEAGVCRDLATLGEHLGLPVGRTVAVRQEATVRR